MTSRRQQIRLALTGSIGMGKSTVGKMFERAGVPLFDADAVVRDLQANDPELITAIGRRFPGTVSAGKLDREHLARTVLGYPAQLEALEAIVHPAVQAAARRLLAGHGRERVEPIAADLGISRRQLERLFRLQIGLPPKRFASLVRFDWIVRHLDGRASWTDLALEAGYADQAHLIRSFSELAGTTPERYVRGVRDVRGAGPA